MGIRNSEDGKKPLPAGNAVDGRFAAFYADTLEKALPGIAAGKKRNVILPLLPGTAAFVVALAVFSFVPELFSVSGRDETNWFSMGLCAAVAGTLAWHCMRRRQLAATDVTLRETVVRPIARYVDPELRYADSDAISRGTFDASLLFDRLREPDSYDGTGVFRGGREGRDFRFSALTVVRAACHGCRIRRGLMLKGLFWEIAGGEPLDGYVVVTPKAAGVTVDIMEHRMRGRAMKAPRLIASSGVPNFDQAFSVFASDRDAFDAFTARQMIWALMDLRDGGQTYPFLSIVGNMLYIAMHTGRGHFRMPGPGEELDLEKCDEYRRDIEAGLRVAGAFCQR